ncbi:hypothetical protein [Desulfoluna butyratoxydans]|uniref:Peptidase c39 bacteriocin processing n=1 Tax=Desulfoluna butyratoxydans TaxID=231438 RepID=A0A4U8YMI7_9BACT|nr:hypothetical protein [Desulfoluna butyratoxydans]VFQ42802.1 hypothetical protein MSL71_4230 [Desulfoluna butyratoxydans]
MKPVIQEETTGCGIAACAALAGIGYQECRTIANRMGILAGDKALWSQTGHVRQLLSELGVPVEQAEIPFTGWEELPDKALLAIKWRMEDGKPFWHWVVFARQHTGSVVLDSKKGLKHNTRRDFGRMKPKWYIPVCS